jgi:GT2 family glycosyltransferase
MSGTTPEIAVACLVVHYGDDAPVRDLVAQLNVQTTPPTHVIVVDNNETSSLTSRNLPPAAFSIRVINTGRNVGFAGGVNCGLAALSGSDITHALILNTDVVLDPRCLERLVDVVGGQASLVAPVGCVIGQRGRSLAWYAGGRFEPGTGRAHQGFGDTLDKAVKPGVIEEVDWLSGCLMLVPMTWAHSAGPVDERYFLYREELDWQLRARAAGLPGPVILREHLLDHVGGGTTGGTDAPYGRAFLARNTILLARSHAGPWLPMWCLVWLRDFVVGPAVRGQWQLISAAVRGLSTAGKAGVDANAALRSLIAT